MDPATPEEFFEGRPVAAAVYERVRALVDSLGAASIATSRSQVAFRRRRGFAYLWRPDRYLRRPTPDVVLAIALPEPVASARWKQVAHPAPTIWMHHLEVRAVEEIDDEVHGWLERAHAAAG